MPSVQRGEVKKLGSGSWAFRYYDEGGRRRQRGGFRTKGEASDALATALDAVRLGPLASRRSLTVRELVDEYLDQHVAEENTIATLRFRLKHATKRWGDVPLERLSAHEIGAWRKRLPEGSAYEIHKALRQVLNAAVEWSLIDENAARKVRNPEPKRSEKLPFETWTDVEAVAEEIGPAWAPLVLFAAATGLRPEELLALEWADVDRRAAVPVASVRRVYTDGRVKPYTKTNRQRQVPLQARALAALDSIARRLDSRLVFPAKLDGHVNLYNWRRRSWDPAVKAAGIEPHRTPYALRHTYATMALRAGISTFDLSRYMGTSLEQIDRTYGHLALDSKERAIALLDAYSDDVSGKKEAK